MAEVSAEDQANINKFSRLNNRHKELSAQLREKKVRRRVGLLGQVRFFMRMSSRWGVLNCTKGKQGGFFPFNLDLVRSRSSRRTWRTRATSW
jgi:hypothetical protein